VSATPAGREPAAGAPVMDVERLVSMANQIGDFFAAYPAGQREEGVRNHLRNYWDPRMRAALLAHVAATGGKGLHAHVLAGARLLGNGATERAAYAGPPRAEGPGMRARGE
jgi:formate dehydrogenase subunit delta